MNDNQKKIFMVALGEKGVTEVAGPKSNERILEYHLTTTLRATSDEVSWCSSFVNWCCKQAGIPSTMSAMARSWLLWGIETKDPQQGDLVVLKRGNDGISGHVGFLAETPSVMNPFIKILGGNQKNMVCVMTFSKLDVLGYREARP